MKIMTNEMKVTHKGVEIGLTADMKFYATVGGEYKTFDSLSRAKGAINKEEESKKVAKAFMEFQVVRMSYSDSKPKLMTINGARFEKSRRKWESNRYYYSVKGSSEEIRNTWDVYPTDKLKEVMKSWKAEQALQKKINALEAQVSKLANERRKICVKAQDIDPNKVPTTA